MSARSYRVSILCGPLRISASSALNSFSNAESAEIRRGPQSKQVMKKRYWIAGAATAAIAGKLMLRPRDADWDKCREIIFHSEHSCFVDVDGIRVHYQEAGDKHAPAMVLIHGFASS